MEHLFLMFLDHTRRSTVGRTPLDEWSARRRDLYLTTHTIDKPPCPRWDSNPRSQHGERLHTYASDHAATATGFSFRLGTLNRSRHLIIHKMSPYQLILGVSFPPPMPHQTEFCRHAENNFSFIAYVHGMLLNKRHIRWKCTIRCVTLVNCSSIPISIINVTALLSQCSWLTGAR